MASKSLPGSTGYFNKDMLAILKKGEKAEKPEKKTTTVKKTTVKKTTSTKKSGKK